jgi:hypothetical protein
MSKKEDILVQKVNKKLNSITDVDKLGEIQTRFCDYKELQFILTAEKNIYFIKYENNKIMSTPVINGEKFCNWAIKSNIDEWNSLEELKNKYGKYSIMMELLDVYKGKEAKQYIDLMHLLR